jgi:hypothetical protein
MTGSMFNSEQEGYMRYLDSLEPETKCWCGWYRLGKCQNGCPTDATCRDKMNAKCKRCGNAPHRPGAELVHLKNCPIQNGDDDARLV